MIKDITIIIGNIAQCGGTEKMAIFLANQLCSDYHVTILSINGNGKPYFKINKNIDIKVLFKNSPNGYISPICQFYLRRFFKRNHTDLIIDVDTILTLVTTPAIKNLGIKHISWDHFNHKFNKSRKNRIKAMDVNSEYVDATVVLSKSDYNYYINNNFTEKNLFQIYNPVMYSDNHYKNNSANKKIIAAGRYTEEKGFDLLLNAWKIVEQNIKDWTLNIYGYTTKNTLAYNIYKDLHLKNAYLYPANNNIEKKYQESSIYVLSSRYEGLGIVLLEACASSLALISFDCPVGPKEIVKHNENGLLVEPENVEKLAEAMLKLINDHELRRKFGKNAYETSKKFTKEKFTKQWLDLIKSLED